MKRKNLIEQIRKKKSFLCVGLDPDLKKLPQHLLKFSDPIFEFNKAIIDATSNYCVAYKPNTAFYEAHGVMGWQSLEKTIVYLKENYPNHFTIADAKRGDIGNTSSMYAQTFFQTMNFDAVTVAPYMGSDSVKPFLNFENKWVVLLALTSNEGAYDFQTEDCSGLRLFEKVLARSMEWGSADNLMYVVGATKAEMLSEIRKIVPDSFLLIPGVGAQGGSLEEVCRYGL
ncbi:MAG: orotidine-5'-phosphate decarboxylase, partial [Bacteroidota bacterium]